jgi:hypothetical protein
MGQATDQIVDRIDRVREELRANLEELETRAKEVTDWRHHFEKHPGKMVIAALVGGALLATLGKKHFP